MSFQQLKKLLLPLLLFVAIAFLVKIGIENYKSIHNKFIYIDLFSIFVATSFCAAMLLTKAVLHVILLQDFKNNLKHKVLILSAYGQAQLIRYLPGKIWGIIFQGEKLEKVFSRKIIWIVNIWQVLITNFNGVGIIIFFILYFYFGPSFPILLSLITIPLTYFLFKLNTLKILIANISKIKFIDLTKLPQISNQSTIVSINKTILLQLEWVFYFLFWIFLLIGNKNLFDCLIIGSVYAGAALIGLIVLVVPSGWFVREASFIWIGINLGYSESDLFFYSVLARLITIVGDVLCAIILSGLSVLTRD